MESLRQNSSLDCFATRYGASRCPGGLGAENAKEPLKVILAQDADIIVCGGTESMFGAPYDLPNEQWGARMGDKKVVGTMIKDGLWDAFNDYHMGTTAENICDVWGITREELD